MPKRDTAGLICATGQAMKEKLDARGHHGDFPDCFTELFLKLKDEVSELSKEIDNLYEASECYLKYGDDYNEKDIIKSIRHEAADVANYAGMVILLCDELIKDGNN